MGADSDAARYRVVVNSEEQYSIWFADRAVPSGWSDVGFSGSRAACLEHIADLWADIRPLSLRRRLGLVRQAGEN